MNGVTFHDDMVKDMMCNKTIDRVLKIIDKHGEQLVHSIIDESFPEIKAADILASVREDVLVLKEGGEAE